MNLRKPVLAAVLALSLATMGLTLGCTAAKPASQGSATDAGAGSSAATPDQTSGDSGMHTSTYKLNGNEIAVVTTDKGTFKFKFFEKEAPNTSATFIEYSLKGGYDGNAFHRVIPGFVAQGGDPTSKGMTSEQVVAAAAQGQLGAGNPGYNLKAEFNPQKHLDGTVAMARAQSPDSAGSQFYICLAPQPSLDGQYTTFGQVFEGLDVVHKLEVGSIIKSITIENASK
jgi:peptidyl-prolyl cis-trans isomerase B (cyclophilin B)